MTVINMQGQEVSSFTPLEQLDHDLHTIWSTARELRAYPDNLLVAAGADEMLLAAENLIKAARGRIWLFNRCKATMTEAGHE